mmetsp:Transcript_30105/g.58846  ORF Transcript_30105/g.58846 Transcript_30105/m.58846 type:complete len:154 (+) Transcript_30105:136-597(+)|eukprot:CAMPEP_0173394360 /NCGR_PEP_ID=MMETSP1356-20130122/27139_1 /TAXON_ID=77927 ORGANISM="Hemiselmis virescens, Strain PCC157" /NCGR_SAMPLE_ID=MMETSP1356 /ASSEMBLY_ACC=CAM_ASM_000847 /LENGTH=153 /DNA_ID=CAMNT_0014352701 /DNA_START=120 /DNA_END=581 /DNA_ORIENTATION=+
MSGHGLTWRTAYKGLIRLALRVPVDDEAAKWRLMATINKSFRKGITVLKPAADGADADPQDPAAEAIPHIDIAYHTLYMLEETFNKDFKKSMRKKGFASLGDEGDMVYALSSGAGNSMFKTCMIDEICRRAGDRAIVAGQIAEGTDERAKAWK